MYLQNHLGILYVYLELYEQYLASCFKYKKRITTERVYLDLLVFRSSHTLSVTQSLSNTLLSLPPSLSLSLSLSALKIIFM